MLVYTNYFQPSFKMINKKQNAPAATKGYSPPATT